jgi:hypothetical protein
MKTKKWLKVMLILVIMIIASYNKVYASLEIKDVDANTPVYTGQTISFFYDLIPQMKDIQQGLEGAKVEVHMANNKEWATVSYFSNSVYGTSGQGKNDGIAVTLPSGVSRYSTNGNLTGVMDWGKTITWTSGMIEGGIASKGGDSLVNNRDTDPYIENVTTLEADKMAITGWHTKWNGLGTSNTYPYSIRKGLFGFNAGGDPIYMSGYNGNSSSGAEMAGGKTTVRPVFYN